MQEYLIEYLIQQRYAGVHTNCTPDETLTAFLTSHVTKKWRKDERRVYWTKIRKMVSLNSTGWEELMKMSRVEIVRNVVKLHKIRKRRNGE